MKRKVMATVLMAAMVAGTMTVNVSAEENLTFWFPTFAESDGEVTDGDFWTEVLKPWEEESNCKVNVEIIPWDNYEEKYLSGTTSNGGPDVGYMYMEMFYDYIENGMLTDIDSYFTDEEKDNYLYWNLGNFMEGQYALPVVVGNPRILVANMDILSEAGVEAVPTTTEEFLNACQAIKENTDYTPFLQDWGSSHYGVLNGIFWPFFWSNGGEICDAEGYLTIDSEAGKKTVEFIKGLYKEGYLSENCTSNDDSLEPFRNGEVAMIYAPSSNILSVDTVNWDYTAVVSGEESAKTFVAADSLVMFESCENKDLAASLMKYVTSANVMSQFHEKVSEQPPLTKDDTYNGDERFKDLFTEHADDFVSLPVFKAAASMYDYLFKDLQSMMLGEMEPADVLTDVTTYYNDNLNF